MRSPITILLTMSREASNRLLKGLYTHKIPVEVVNIKPDAYLDIQISLLL